MSWVQAEQGKASAMDDNGKIAPSKSGVGDTQRNKSAFPKSREKGAGFGALRHMRRAGARACRAIRAQAAACIETISWWRQIARPLRFAA